MSYNVCNMLWKHNCEAPPLESRPENKDIKMSIIWDLEVTLFFPFLPSFPFLLFSSQEELI